MIHIGKYIKDVLQEKELSVSQFAAMMHISRATAYRLLENDSIDVHQLERISKLLNHNLLDKSYLEAKMDIENNDSMKKGVSNVETSQ
jgi:transcriptional regulator with XRE-family HTH domain